MARVMRVAFAAILIYAMATPICLAQAPAVVVVVDPGHGGRDKGVVFPDQATEKTVTLELARALRAELRNRYRVILTRTDDYDLVLDNRTALANHHRARLFISLHTGLAQGPTARNGAVFVYGTSDKIPRDLPSDFSDLTWDTSQLPHVDASRRLAKAIQEARQTADPQMEVRILQAPVAILKGADMPAVLVEFAYRPADSDNTGPDSQALWAQSMAQAIDRFLGR